MLRLKILVNSFKFYKISSTYCHFLFKNFQKIGSSKVNKFHEIENCQFVSREFCKRTLTFDHCHTNLVDCSKAFMYLFHSSTELFASIPWHLPTIIKSNWIPIRFHNRFYCKTNIKIQTRIKKKISDIFRVLWHFMHL